MHAPVAQLDRASDFGSDGWGFDSLQAHSSFPDLGDRTALPVPQCVTLPFRCAGSIVTTTRSDISLLLSRLSCEDGNYIASAKHRTDVIDPEE